MPSSDLLPVTIRPAYADDEPTLWRLAALDSAAVPRGRLIVAEVDGQIRVAVSQDDLHALADPFAPTADLVALVRAHISGLAGQASGRPRPRAPRPAWAA